MLRRAALLIALPTTLVLAAGPAFAHQCVNASKKNQAAGVQIVFGDGDDPLWVSRGLQRRIDKGLVDLDTGEGFHGLLGIDVTGDGVVDFATYIVGPESEIPVPAQMNGADCKGIVNVEQFFACFA
jgi:hypothetical protein